MYHNIDIDKIIDTIIDEKLRVCLQYTNVYPVYAIMKKIIGKSDVKFYLFSDIALRHLNVFANSTGIDLSKVETVVINREGISNPIIDDPGGIIVTYGCVILKIWSDNYLSFVVNFLEKLPKETAIISTSPYNAFEEVERSILHNLFDVAIVVKKSEDVFYFGEEVYELSIVHSLTQKLPPGTGYFKVDKDMDIVESE